MRRTAGPPRSRPTRSSSGHRTQRRRPSPSRARDRGNVRRRRPRRVDDLGERPAVEERALGAAAVGASATQAEVVSPRRRGRTRRGLVRREAEALGGVRIDVAVTFENYLGGSGSGAYAVTIADGAIPSVEIVGGRERTAGRSRGPPRLRHGGGGDGLWGPRYGQARLFLVPGRERSDGRDHRGGRIHGSARLRGAAVLARRSRVVRVARRGHRRRWPVQRRRGGHHGRACAARRAHQRRLGARRLDERGPRRRRVRELRSGNAAGRRERARLCVDVHRERLPVARVPSVRADTDCGRAAGARRVRLRRRRLGGAAGRPRRQCGGRGVCVIGVFP